MSLKLSVPPASAAKWKLTVPHTSADLRDRLAELMQVTAEDRAVLLPSGSQPLFTNRVAWAVIHLAQAGLLDRLARGITQLTARCQQVLQECPDRVDMKVLRRFPEYEEFRTRTRQRKGQPQQVSKTASDLAQDELAPREAITEVIDSAHSAVAADLLARVLKQPPVFLEQFVLRLLVKRYSGLETTTEHLGGPGDVGLDGLIRLDPLGLDVVYVQAKRYTDHHIGRPDIQAFVGALHGTQASRGIFITTSRVVETRSAAARTSPVVPSIDGRSRCERWRPGQDGETVSAVAPSARLSWPGPDSGQAHELCRCTPRLQ